MVDVEVRDDAAEHRYEARVDGVVAGASYYRAEDDVVVFTHTEVGEEFEGQGVGSALARQALDDVRRRGQRVVPQCPFVSRWIERHPDYQDLVTSS